MGCSSLTAVETFHFPASHQKSQYSVQTINAVLDTDSRQTLHLQQNIFAKDSCGRQTVHQKRIPNHLAYRKVLDENSQYQANQSTLQGQVQSLQNENDDLKNQIQILKGTLLNTYSSDEINSVIEQGGLKRDISKRLDNLECLDSVHCEQVPSVKDLYGTTHSVSYRFDASDTAWAKFKLDGQYDTFSANIVTSEDTNRDANMSVEIYLDDVLVGRVDDVVRDEHVRPISVSVNGGNVLMIKVIRTNSYYSSYAYICDTSLSVLQ